MVADDSDTNLRSLYNISKRKEIIKPKKGCFKQCLFFLADDGEVFQVKKSTQSKKIMKLLDRERKKKKEVKKEGEKVEAVECEDKVEDALDLVVMLMSLVSM